MLATALQRGNRSAQYAPHMLRVRKAGSVRRAGSAGYLPTVLALETIGKWPGTNSNRCVGAARSTRACGPRDHLSGAAIGERVYAKHAVSWLAGALAELHSSRWTLSDELFDNPLKNPEGRALPAIPWTGVGRRKPRVEFVVGGYGPYSPSQGYARWRARDAGGSHHYSRE
jgi:hypothetical protein